jgi:tetratricopeptide (TPR) repeat protein
MPNPPVEIPPAELAKIKELYLDGKYAAAYRLGNGFGPLRGWTGSAARLLAGRLAMQLGAPRLGRQLHLQAYRESPAYPEATYYHARYRMERFGPLSCWAFMRQHPDWSESSPELRADWLALQGFTYARLRDFDTAEKLLAQSETISPRRPWHYVERSSIFEFQDKLDDGLAAARQSLEIQPWFRPGVQSVAHLLVRKGREPEACSFLEEAAGHLESSLVLAQLANLQIDLGRYGAARETVERFAELSPMMERDVAKWLAARRSDLAYFLGDFPAAVQAARTVDDDETFYAAFAERLERVINPTPAPPPGSGEGEQSPSDPPRFGEGGSRSEPGGVFSPTRELLPLDLGYETTPPSAAELLARFWNVPAPPAPDEGFVPLDGLPDSAERERFHTAGWKTIEFTLTKDAAAQLLARKVPFLVTLVEAGFGQSRLIYGYDALRNTLMMAEGLERKPVETPLPILLERFRATGPRCLAAVPPGNETALEGLALPNAAEYDLLHTAQVRIKEQRFGAAKELLEALEYPLPLRERVERSAATDGERGTSSELAETPLPADPLRGSTTLPLKGGGSNSLSKFAALAWAKATQHPVLMLEAVDELLKDHPKEVTFAMAKGNVLRELGLPAERLAFLREQAEAEKADPLMMQSLAQAILQRPDEQHEAERLLRRSIRLRPHAPSGYYLLGAQWWEQGRFAESVELHRFACCLDEREEQFAEAYFRVARASGQVSDAVRLLQRRSQRAEVPQPPLVRAFVNALRERGEPDFARTALDKAIEKLAARVTPLSPKAERDALGELRLYSAESLANAGRIDEAELELEAARPDCTPAAYSKVAARIARTKPNFRAALLNLQELAVHDPLNPEMHRLSAGLLQDTAGKAAAQAYLKEQVERFPHFYPLARLRAEFLAPDADEAAFRATRDLVEFCPRDAWAWRQLALVLGDRKSLNDALEAVQTSARYEPTHPSYYAVLANIHRRADRTEDAIAAFREGISRFADHELAIAELVRTARGAKEKKAMLAFILGELRRQPTTGEGLLAYRDQSLGLIEDPEELSALYDELDEFLEERPDLWTAWSVVIQQLIMTHRAEEAYSLAQNATARFPLLSRLWLDLAEACKHTNHPEERIEALRKAVECSPGWAQPVKELSDALVEEEEREEAVAVLEKYLARSPLDPLAHSFLAERLWESDRGEEALKHAEQAVRQEPGYDLAWSIVANWGERLDRPDAMLDLARDLARDRAGDARVFMKLARSLQRFDQTEEALAALDHAIALEPKNPEPYDLKAERLAEVGRYDEALAAANPPALADNMPLILQGRAAWVESRRGNFGVAIPTMQALVSVDPGYYWGWQQLAEWFQETGKPEPFLEAASEMAKLRPDHPVPLTMRGEAKIRTGDREGGKADLREALRLHPGYSPAAATLFDACLEDGEWKEARTALAVLQEHMAGPEGLVRQLSYAIKTNDVEGASRTFSEICMAPGEAPPSLLQMGLNEMRAAGFDETAVAAMYDAWNQAEPFNPWAALFWLDSPAGEQSDLETRLRACDAVLAHYPNFIPGHDRKTEQLARGERYEEARAACRPPHMQPPPITLRGRAAWVEATYGARLNDESAKREAIRMMRECLAEDPEYAWGWRQVAYWHDDLGEHRECLEAADRLVQLSPGDPHALGLRGEAKRVLNDHRGARDDFQLAFEIDPNFAPAGHQLINEQLATDDISGAQRTLETLRGQDDDAVLKLRAVQLAARRKDLAEARNALGALAGDADTPRSMLRDATKEFDEQDWAKEADAELAGHIETGDCPPAVAAIWAERLITAGNAEKVADRLKELVERTPDSGAEAVQVYAWAMAVTGQPDRATATIQRFAELLRKTTEGWARAGVTLAEAKRYPLAVAWLQEWKSRAGVEPWMVRALAESYRARGEDDLAEATTRAALELDPGDFPPDMRVWLVIADALAGRTESAKEHRKRIDPDLLLPGPQLMLAAADAMLKVQTAEAAARPSAWVEARKEIKEALAACPNTEVPAAFGKWYRRIVRRMATDAGGLKAKLWSWWKTVNPKIK